MNIQLIVLEHFMFDINYNQKKYTNQRQTMNDL